MPPQLQILNNYKEETDNTAYSRDLIILRKPRPNYTDSARHNRVQGTVRLKITFLANGQIGQVFVLAPLKGGLTEEAFAAVKKIRFVPAEIDGKPVDITRIIEYSFSIESD